VELVAVQVDGGELSVGDVDALGVVALIKLFGGRRGDRVDDDLVADERAPPPVLCDEAPEAVLDLG